MNNINEKHLPLISNRLVRSKIPAIREQEMNIKVVVKTEFTRVEMEFLYTAKLAEEYHELRHAGVFTQPEEAADVIDVLAAIDYHRLSVPSELLDLAKAELARHREDERMADIIDAERLKKWSAKGDFIQPTLIIYELRNK